MRISLLGIGSVGKELIRQTLDNPEDRYIAIADTSGVIAKYSGFSRNELEKIIALKESNRKLKEYVGNKVNFFDDIRKSFEYEPDVLIDVTTAQTYDTLYDALNNGIHVIGSNKVPYAEVSYGLYKKLFSKADEVKRIIDNRTVVSANLGVLSRVREFADTGGVQRIEGCFSGTMAYVSYCINQGIPFSKAVEEAKDKKFTESDPRIDLSGIDFARKVVIVGRTGGKPIELSEIKCEDIVPEELKAVSIDEFMKRLPVLDGPIKLRAEKAKSRENRLRYLGELDFETTTYNIGFMEVPLDDKQATATGCDNIVTIYPRLWNGGSTTISGPGAGIIETVSGLLAGLHDIQMIGTYERRIEVWPKLEKVLEKYFYDFDIVSYEKQAEKGTRKFLIHAKNRYSSQETKIETTVTEHGIVRIKEGSNRIITKLTEF